MRGFVVTLSAVVAVAVTAGCGGGSGGGSSRGAVSLDKFPSEYAKVVCPQNLKCCSAEEVMGRTKEECETNTSSAYTLLVPMISDSQSRGRVVYHADKMGQCLGALAALSCDDWKKGADDEMAPEPCQQVFEPKVANGGVCASEFDCTSHNCLGDQVAIAGMPAKEGVCVADVARGGTCDPDDSACAADNYCDFATMKCVAQKAEGAACDDPDQCASGNCNMDTNTCGPRSCYVGCSVAGTASPGVVLVSVFGWAAVGLALSLARRRRQRR